MNKLSVIWPLTDANIKVTSCLYLRKLSGKHTMIPVFLLSEKKCQYAVAVHNVSLPATGVRRVWVPVTGHARGICGKELLPFAKGVLRDTPGKLFKLYVQNPAF